MDWKDLGPIVGGSAPLIGKLISIGVSFIPGIGPIAGPIIGPAIGNILAGAFGVPATPDAVAGAIASNPDEVVKAKLAAATEQVKAQYDWAAKVETGELHLQEVALTQTGETMRAELAHEHWYFTGWRPAAGWIFDLFALLFGGMLTVAMGAAAFGNDPVPLKILTEAWPLFVGYLGALALMVGVYIVGRSSEKGKAIENAAPMPNALPPVPTTGGGKPMVAPVKAVVATTPKPKPPGSRD